MFNRFILFAVTLLTHLQHFCQLPTGIHKCTYLSFQCFPSYKFMMSFLDVGTSKLFVFAVNDSLDPKI